MCFGGILILAADRLMDHCSLPLKQVRFLLLQGNFLLTSRITSKSDRTMFVVAEMDFFFLLGRFRLSLLTEFLKTITEIHPVFSESFVNSGQDSRLPDKTNLKQLLLKNPYSVWNTIFSNNNKKSIISKSKKISLCLKRNVWCHMYRHV